MKLIIFFIKLVQKVIKTNKLNEFVKIKSINF